MKNSNIPDHFQYIIPIIKAMIKLNGSGKAIEIKNLIIKELESSEDRPNGIILSEESEVIHQIQLAKCTLEKAGYIETISGDTWSFTDKGEIIIKEINSDPQFLLKIYLITDQNEHTDVKREKDQGEKSRSEIQWDLFKFNIIWSGIAVGFGIKFKLIAALFLPSIISFMLFTYWFHQGIVIIVDREKRGYFRYKSKSKFIEGLRQFSILVALSFNFIALPILSLYYANFLTNKMANCETDDVVLKLPEGMMICLTNFGYLLLFFSIVFIILWIILEYYYRDKIGKDRGHILNNKY